MNLPTRLPPMALDAEQAALAACLVDRRCVDRLLTDLAPEDFYFQCNQSLYLGIEALANEKQQIDTVTLAEKMRQQGTLESAGGIDYVKQVYGTLQNPRMFPAYVEPIADCSVRRMLIEIARSLDDAAHEGQQTGVEVAEDFAIALQAVASNKTATEGRTAKTVFSERREQIRNREKTPIIKLGQPDLDDLLLVHPGDLIVVAGILNTGKSGTAMNMLLSAIESGVETELWTLEMMEREYADRMIAAKAGINAKRLSLGELNQTEMELADQWGEWLEQQPLRFYESTPNVEALRGQLRMNAKKFGTQLVFVDQLRQLNSRLKHENETLKLGYIAQQLKQSARENKNAVFLLHQVNRGADDVGPPEIKHLRQSGIIAEDCDAILMIYQPERRKEHKSRVYADEVELEWIIPRQRNGPKGMLRRTFRLSTQQIYAMSEVVGEEETTEETRRDAWG